MIEKLESIEIQIRTLDKKNDKGYETLKLGQDIIDAKVTYTNGKVRKIIIAFVLLAGIVIGQSTTNFSDVAKFFIGIIT